MDEWTAIMLAAEWPHLVKAERDRRLAMGFTYDFEDGRGVHHIGTSADDMRGWNEVTMSAQAAVALGAGSDPLTTLLTDTGPATVTALEWMAILQAAHAARQPIWHRSFEIAAMSPDTVALASDALWEAT